MEGGELDHYYDLPAFNSLTEGSVSQDGLQILLGTGDLSIGSHRVGLALVSSTGLVSDPVASVTVRYVGDEGETDFDELTVQGIFRPWPYGNRGLYTADLDFDLAGPWDLSITVQADGGASRSAVVSIEVSNVALAPGRGEPAPKSINRVAADVDSLGQLTSGPLRDPDLYEITIASAIESGLPTVIVFASPAFCTNVVCGPQVEVLSKIKDLYKGQANFIHVDIYDNPDEIQGDLSLARISSVVKEWRLPSIEWTFVLDRQGVISARFEAFATFEEVKKALKEVL